MMKTKSLQGEKETDKKFQGTKISLGSSVSVHIIKNKAKFKPVNSGFCAYCFLMVDLTIDGNCTICGHEVMRKKSFDSAKKRFEIFIDENKEFLDDWIADRKENEQLKIPILLGHKTYLVALRYFKEFENLAFTDDNSNSYEMFFNYIKSISKPCKN